MKQYYYSEEGEKKGPFPLSDFQNINITSETLIWSEGFSVWTRAKDLEEFVPILSMMYVFKPKWTGDSQS